MEMKNYVDEIKLELTGNLLTLEIPDETIELVVKKAFREVQRFIDTTKYITVPFSRCIDLADSKVSAVVGVYRAQAIGNVSATGGLQTQADPMQLAHWQFMTGGGGDIYNLNEWVSNYAAWNTMVQIRNTTSTDLALRYDKIGEKLYINVTDTPPSITIEFVPKFESVNEITSDYWIDILMRMSVALTKITLGRIRSRYVQSNALWTQDGETMLAEGNAEIESLREILRVNSQLGFPIS